MTNVIEKKETIGRSDQIEIVDKGTVGKDINGGMCCHGTLAPIR